MISHSVKDQHSIQLDFASLNRTSTFHLMQNLVPFHDLPFAICILASQLDHQSSTLNVEVFAFSLFKILCHLRWVDLHQGHYLVCLGGGGGGFSLP